MKYFFDPTFGPKRLGIRQIGRLSRIRTNIASNAHFKPVGAARLKLAAPTRLKVAHSHFKVATLRMAGVRDEPVIDNARNSNVARRQYPLKGRWRSASTRANDYAAHSVTSTALLRNVGRRFSKYVVPD